MNNLFATRQSSTFVTIKPYKESNMKKVRILLFLLLVTSSISVDAQWWRRHDRRGRPRYHHRHHRNHPGNVAVPLDGGLLTVLGAAGIGFYLVRKKKKQGE
jgi:hypothetical protein